MLLGLRRDGAIVYQRTACNAVFAIIDRDCRVHKIAVLVPMPNPQFRELAGAAGHRIGVTRDARCGVKYRAQSALRIVDLFKAFLIEGEGVARGLGDSIARAFGTW